MMYMCNYIFVKTLRMYSYGLWVIMMCLQVYQLKYTCCSVGNIDDGRLCMCGEFMYHPLTSAMNLKLLLKNKTLKKKIKTLNGSLN